MPSIAVQMVLQSARNLLGDLLKAGRPRFHSMRELDIFLRQEGYRLAIKDGNAAFGPAGGRQLILRGPARSPMARPGRCWPVIVKVKTRGYANGMRPNGTMSVEVTRGGTGWEHTLFKLDANGRIIPKNILGSNRAVVRPRTECWSRPTPGSEKFRMRPGGTPQYLAPWEVIEGDRATPNRPGCVREPGPPRLRARLRSPGGRHPLSPGGAIRGPPRPSDASGRPRRAARGPRPLSWPSPTRGKGFPPHCRTPSPKRSRGSRDGGWGTSGASRTCWPRSLPSAALTTANTRTVTRSGPCLRTCTKRIELG